MTLRTLFISAVVLTLAACQPQTTGTGTTPMTPGPGTNPPPPGTNPPPPPPPGTPDAGGMTPVTPGASLPGAACNCDSECQGSTANPGICVMGVCMTRASGECSAGGSQAECGAGSRCWTLSGSSDSICWPDCASYDCAGACDSDGSCVPNDSNSCDPSCGSFCGDGGGSGGGSGGSDGCPPNSSLNEAGDGCVCDEGYVVNEDRTACVAECTSAADCSGTMICEDMRCVEPPCTSTSCPEGTICSSSGDCVIDIGTPPAGPVPSCRPGTSSIPDWRCSGSSCGRLVPFDPDEGPGYWDYPLNGETSSDQYRSYVRQDVMMLVKYAAAMTECLSAGWRFGNREPLGLGDMSEADGSIPGTREGRPGHPAGTHVDGHDMDIAYYQTGTPDNRLRSVCPHTSGGSDVYHCTGAPTLLDPWRTALFLGLTHQSPNLRVIGVDGRIGPLVDSAMTQLCTAGYLTGPACTSSGRAVTWESTDMGRGWYRFHHHHFHISVSGS